MCAVTEDLRVRVDGHDDGVCELATSCQVTYQRGQRDGLARLSCVLEESKCQPARHHGERL